VDSDRNLLLVKGAIPGSKSGFVKVKLSAKKDKVNAGISQQLQAQKDAWPYMLLSLGEPMIGCSLLQKQTLLLQ
jgi:hypothetical protein